MDIVKWEQPDFERIGRLNDYPWNNYDGGSVLCTLCGVWSIFCKAFLKCSTGRWADTAATAATAAILLTGT